MKLFCSTPMTNEDGKELARRMRLINDALNTAGHEMYCQVLDPRVQNHETDDVKAVLTYAFEKLADCDGVVAVVTNKQKSEGQLMEIGVALMIGKPIFLFVHQSARDIPSHLPKIADKTYYWRTDDELRTALGQFRA